MVHPNTWYTTFSGVVLEWRENLEFLLFKQTPKNLRQCRWMSGGLWCYLMEMDEWQGSWMQTNLESTSVLCVFARLLQHPTQFHVLYVTLLVECIVYWKVFSALHSLLVHSLIKQAVALWRKVGLPRGGDIMSLPALSSLPICTTAALDMEKANMHLVCYTLTKYCAFFFL